MMYGFAGPWYGAFLTRDGVRPGNDEDRLRKQLAFLRDFGLQSTAMRPGAWLALRPAFREEMAALLVEHDLHLNAHFALPYFTATPAELQERAEAFLANLRAASPEMRCVVVSGCAGPIHRFVRDPSLTEQLKRLAAGVAPIVDGCLELGLPVGLENHGDYYCSDLAELCERVPGLGIFLDTGNTYLIGERPVPAYQAAAPYVMGGHFKDHHVHPDPGTLHFVLQGAALGEGDADLRTCWDILKRHTPRLDHVCLEIEMIWDKERYADPIACLEASLTFARSLS